MLTKEALAEIEQRHKAATPGPWFATDIDYPDGGNGPMQSDAVGAEGRFTISTDPGEAGWHHDGGYPGYGISEDNAKFAAHARTDIPALLAHIAELDARVADSESDCFKLGEEIAALRRDAEEARRLAMAVADKQFTARGGYGEIRCACCTTIQEDDGEVHAFDCPVAAYRAHVTGEG